MSETKRRKINIPTAQYQELELLAKRHEISIEDLVDQLLEKEIVDNARKDIFSPGLKWTLPGGKEAIIMARIQSQDLTKLNKWLNRSDRLQICPMKKDGELLIINQSAVMLREIEAAEASKA